MSAGMTRMRREYEEVISTFGRTMIELGPILVKIEHQARYGEGKAQEDAGALFGMYLKYKKLDLDEELNGKMIYSFADRMIDFEATDERQEKEEDYDAAVRRIKEDYDGVIESIETDYTSIEAEILGVSSNFETAKSVGKRAALFLSTYFGSQQILSHTMNEYVDAALALAFVAWTGYEGYDSRRRKKRLIEAKVEKAESGRTAKKDRDKNLSRARTWKKLSRRHLYRLADLRKEHVKEICEEGLTGFPDKSPVERDDEFRTLYGLWLPPVDKYIKEPITTSEEIKRMALKLKRQVRSMAVSS